MLKKVCICGKQSQNLNDQLCSYCKKEDWVWLEYEEVTFEQEKAEAKKSRDSQAKKAKKRQSHFDKNRIPTSKPGLYKYKK